jgi:hypothetical protein
MDQGLVLELVVRLYHVTHNPRYLKAADKIFQSFKNVNRDSYPWVVYITPDKYYWIEEYPMDVPDNVLNGFIFGLFGLYEYWMLTKDPEAKFYIDASLSTLQDKLPLFRNPGGISYYCLKHHHQDPLYHSLHINLIRFLYKMTGEQFFKDFKDFLSKLPQALIPYFLPTC